MDSKLEKEKRNQEFRIDLDIDKLLEKFSSQSFSEHSFDPNQKSKKKFGDLEENKIKEEYIKRELFFQNNSKLWESIIQIMASRDAFSKKHLESIRKLKKNTKALLEFLPKFLISLNIYESILLLNEKHEELQKLLKKLKSVKSAIEYDDSEIHPKISFNNSLERFVIMISEYEEKLSELKNKDLRIEEMYIKLENKIKVLRSDIYQKKLSYEEKNIEFERINELQIIREKRNKILQKPLQAIKIVEIEEYGHRNSWLEMDIHEDLGYTAKVFFSMGNLNFFINLIDNTTGEIIQEILIKEFKNGNYPRCKWTNTKKIENLRLIVFYYFSNLGFILEFDKKTKKLKEIYEKFEIGNSDNYQLNYSAKYGIMNHGISKGITVFDIRTHEIIKNVTGSKTVLVGEFYGDNNYLYADEENKIFHYNLKNKKHHIVKVDHPDNYIYSIKLSKETNTLIIGHSNGNIYIYKLNLTSKKLIKLLKSVSTGVSIGITRIELINFDKLMIAKQEKTLKIVEIKSGIIVDQEIINGNQLEIDDFKFDEKNEIAIVLTCGKRKSKIHFLK